MDNFGFQEPCCIENTLPILLRKYGLVTWQSNGDVTFEKIMKAVACMAGNELSVVLVVPEIDIPMLRYLRWLNQRGWLLRLAILTQKNQQELIRGEMPADMDLAIYNHKSVTEGTIIIYGENNTVVVLGSLHSAVTPALENYTTYMGCDQDRVSMLTDAVTSRLRLLDKKKKPAEGEAETKEEVPADAPCETEDSKTE